MANNPPKNNSQNRPLCGSCGISKDLSCFSKNRSKKSGYNSICKECHKKAAKAHYANNKDKYAVLAKAYVSKNRAKISAYQLEWYYKKKSDIQFRIKNNLRARLRSALKHNLKTGSAIRDLGCFVSDLRKHLESKFQSEMTWENYGVYWEIDHIKPLATFDLTNQEEFKQACHWTNLQPLTVHDNRSKGNGRD